MYTRDWPWKKNRCRGCRSLDCESVTTWTVRCMSCGEDFCEYHPTDACQACGTLVCPGCQQKRRHKDCPRAIPDMHRHYDKCYSGLPWLRKIRAGLPCSQCTSMRDIGEHSCQRCGMPQCLDVRCVSALVTCHGSCGRDVCGLCLPASCRRGVPHWPRLWPVPTDDSLRSERYRTWICVDCDFE